MNIVSESSNHNNKNNSSNNKDELIDNNLKNLFKKIDIALKSTPPPPDYIPNNLTTSYCNVCCNQWFENTITMFWCQCRDLHVCPNCAYEMKEPEEMEHNLVDCNYVGSDIDNEQ